MFWFLIIAHMFADMALQPSFFAKKKAERPGIMLFHTMMVTGAVSIPIFIFGTLTYPIIAFLIVTHFIIDSWKSRVPKDDAHFYAIYLDQGLHFVCMILGAVAAGVPFTF